MVRAFLNSQSCRNKKTNPQARVIITQNINRKDQSNRLIISIRLIIRGLEQSKVDKSMEIFLDKIEENIDYDKWYCGHFHTEKQIDKLEFMFGRIKLFNKDEFYPKNNRNGYQIIRAAYSQNEVMKEEVVCPKCHCKDISVVKGDGFRIDGADFIGITCNNCKKVYGFSDVKYKPNCPKEL